MQAGEEAAGAAPAARRIEALDVVRGAALLGILLMNITDMGLPFAYYDPVTAGGATGANFWAWIITNVGFEGTQRALFSLLFGAGVILFTSKPGPEGAVLDLFLRRSLWLILFGMVNAFILLWTGDILYYYGITALFVLAFRNASPRALLAIGGSALLLGAAWNALDSVNLLSSHSRAEAALAAKASGATLSEEQKGAIAAWKEVEEGAHPPADKVKEKIDATTSGYWSAMKDRARETVHYESWYLYRFFFDVFAMMLIGMALYKLRILTAERPARFYLAMMAIGYPIGLAINIAETWWLVSHGFSALASSQQAISYDLGRVAMTTGHLGALLLFVRSGILPWLRRSLASVGQMALSNYLTHSIVTTILFVGFGLYGRLERHELYYVVFAIWAAQLVISPVWLKHFRFGPAEWLWRSLTYRRRQPFLRGRPGEPKLAEAML
jgi:uncharacterized protein